MGKDGFWLLDAHCDSLERRDFLNHDFNLTKSHYLVSKSTQKFIEKTFKGREIAPEEYNYHVTFSRLKQGNVKVLFLNVAYFDLLKSSKMISAVYDLVDKHSDKVALCYNYQDICCAVKENKTALILSAEGPLVFHGQLDLLRNWHRLGIRVVNLTHGEGTQGLTQDDKSIYKDLVKLAPQCALQISTSCVRYLSAKAREQLYKKEKGLSAIGKKMLQEMGKLNIICDLSHANDAAFWEVIETSAGKLCATHSNCAALCGHTRNLTDEMMKVLAARGGVMGLCFYGHFIDEHKPSLNLFIQHILHALDIMGSDHVGIGGDYDGVGPGSFMAIAHPGKINQLWEALDKAGVDKKTIEKIAHKNFMRLLNSD